MGELGRARPGGSGRRSRCALSRARSDRRRGGDTHRHEIGELRNQGAELELREQRRQHVGVGCAYPQLFEVECDRHIAPQRHELARQAGVVGLCEQRFAGALAGDVGGLRQNPVEVAVGLEQLHGGLLADPLHARNVVGAVTDQREVVDDPFGRNAEPFAGIRLIDPLFLDGRLAAASRVEQRDSRTDQLVKVFVARDDDGLQPVGDRVLRECRHDIVGLVAVDRDDRYVERIEDLTDPFERTVEVLLQLRTQLFAGRFVLRILRRAE